MMYDAPIGDAGWPGATLVGREHERRQLGGQLDAALTGRGSLVLLGGEAGIGKTALVRNLGASAAERGCLVLTGTCYDVGVTPPYSPWRDLVSTARRVDLPESSALAWGDESISSAPTANAVVAALRAYLDRFMEHGPLVLVLEDLHWADPESLEFLRIFARQAGQLPVLLLATYRDEELTPNHRLHQLIPHLVRESNAQRVSVRRLDKPGIEALVARRYALPHSDLVSLATYLESRSQGVPLYVVELLRTLEEDQSLHHTPNGWLLSDINMTKVPALIRQVIDGRIDRFDPEIRRLLELAAVIGQEVPLRLWRRVSGVDGDLFDEAIERALQAHVLEVRLAPLYLQFTHALVRDALYASVPLSRRQMWHRRIAESLVGDGGVEPDTVAHHFQRALDPRAIEWFISAGSRAERVAWLTAARHFEMAFEMMEAGEVNPSERGWLLIRRAKLLRYAEPRTALAILEAAEELAIEAHDPLLVAYVTFFRGQIRCLAGEMRNGMVDLAASVGALARLEAVDLQRADELERRGVVVGRAEAEGLLAALLGTVGRIDEALERSERIIALADGTPVRAWWARAIALALAGRPREANDAFLACREALTRAADHSTIASLLTYQISLVQLPYGADDLDERRRIADEAVAAWQRSGGALGDASSRIAALPLLQLEGDWQVGRELALRGTRSSDATSQMHLVSTVILAQLARAQGDAELTWALIHQSLPGGPQARPGNADLAPALALMREAAALSLDVGDVSSALAWLDAHDRWLVWSGAALGRAEGQIAWADYYRHAGDVDRARGCVQHALTLAGAPRQPLVLLAAHRLLGELDIHAGQFSDAQEHLNSALALSNACHAPFEQALTLIIAADLHHRGGAPEQAHLAVDAARASCRALGAAPALARADALAARLAESPAIRASTISVGLSAREVEVLRLLATGRSNREVAAALFLSVRTVERHLTNLYTKIGAQSRAEAIAFAHQHALVEAPLPAGRVRRPT